VSSEERDILHAGGRFAFAYELWFDRGMLDRKRPTDIDVECPRRFEDPDRQKLTTLAELYETLSPSLLSALESPERSQSFKDSVRPLTLLLPFTLADHSSKFIHQLNQERSNMVFSAHRVAPGLLGLDAHLLRTQTNRLGNPKIQALLQNPKKPGEMYPIFAPILFPEMDCNNPAKVFQSKPLAGVRRYDPYLISYC